MAGTRTRSKAGSEQSRAARAAAVAEELHHECTVLLELYRKKETFSPELTVGEHRLVSVAPLSSQLTASDRVWRLYSALKQCQSLLERAIVREEEEVGGGAIGEYEGQRKTVKDRLGHLIDSTRPLLVEGEGTATFTPKPDSIEIDGPVNGGLFGLKLWIFRIFNELEHWTSTAGSTLLALPPALAKPPPGRRGRARGRKARR